MTEYRVLVRRDAEKGTWTSEAVPAARASSLDFSSPSMGPARVAFLADLDHKPSAAEVEKIVGKFDDGAEVALIEQRARDAAAAPGADVDAPEDTSS